MAWANLGGEVVDSGEHPPKPANSKWQVVDR